MIDMHELPPDEFVVKYRFMNNTDLIQALFKGYEVCISGAYIAVRAPDLGTYSTFLSNLQLSSG